MKFRIIIRFTDDGLAARSVDFPELTATGRRVEEVEDRLFDAIRERIEALQAERQWNELFAPQLPAQLQNAVLPDPLAKQESPLGAATKARGNANA